MNNGGREFYCRLAADAVNTFRRAGGGYGMPDTNRNVPGNRNRFPLGPASRAGNLDLLQNSSRSFGLEAFLGAVIARCQRGRCARA